MENNRSQTIIKDLVTWAEQQHSVRAMILTSSRANPQAHTDIWSDYDIILVVKDVRPYFEDRSWLTIFGKVLVTYWDDIHFLADYGLAQVGNVIQYEDLRIDFTLWPTELLQKITESAKLPATLDDGYHILLDKDGLTSKLHAPTYTVYIPTRPSNAEFQKVVEDFLSVAPHLAKCLWRDELLPAKWCLDYDMKHNFLRRMLEWRVEIDHNWDLPVGDLGKGLKKQLSLDIWKQVEKTYAGADITENWDALLQTLSLFRQVALEVATQLGFRYPEDMHQGVVNYTIMVRQQPRK